MSSGQIRPLSLDEIALFGSNGNGNGGDVAGVWEQDCLPQGVQDNALTALAGFVREHQLWRFSEEGIYHLLLAVTSNGTLDQDPRRPYTERDCRRIAHSIATHPVGEPTYELEVAHVVCEVPIVGEPVDWWLHGFIPMNELCMLYGAKASGKSTFGSWLSAVVTQAEGNFLHIGVEEPYARFRGRALIGGAVRERLFGWKGPLRLPEDVDALEEAIKRYDLRFIYLDSIYTHFTAARGTLENTRARSNLEPLALLAQRCGVTVLGNFHDRRSDGSYMGSTEMINVARVVLKLDRPAGAASRLHFEIGNYTEPNYALRLNASDVELHDPATGEIQMERQRDGSLAPQILKVITSVEEIPVGGTSADLAEIGTAARQEHSTNRAAEAQRLSDEGLGTSEIAERLDISPRSVRRYLHGGADE